MVTGSPALTAEGKKPDGQAGMVDLGALTGGKVRELPFTFRYFQNLEQEIAIPAGFVPERLTVEVRSGKKGISPVTADLPLERRCELTGARSPRVGADKSYVRP